jgi:hypothetical protein
MRPREERPLIAVPLWIDSAGAATSAQPITVGIPFARGVLTDPAPLLLHDADDRRRSVQAQPLARWADGSVKWLLVDFLAWLPAEGSTRYTLEQTTDRPPATGLRVEESPAAVVVATGAAVFHLSRTDGQLLQTATISDKDILESGSCRTVLTDAAGQTGVPRIDQVHLEARGPVRATVRLEGSFTGRVPCRFVARCCFFAGTGLVRLRLTVHNPKRARHRGGLWDLGDPGSMWFRDLSFELGLAGRRDPRRSWRTELGQAPTTDQRGNLEIYQDSSGGEQWQSRNHVNREGRVPCSFRGYRVRSAGGETFGLRASPVVSLHGSGGWIAAAVPEFWQQFPKALEVEGHILRVRLFPGQFADLFELQGGEQKTHTIWLDFGVGGGPEGTPLDWVHRPARAHAAPEWYAASGVIPYLAPASAEPGDRLESFLAVAVEGPKSFGARREIIDEYGWRNYGDVYADHEEAYYDGPKPIISHYNNQYDVIYGTLLQYLRTGAAGWFDLGDALARHVVDIDIYHTDRDRAAYNGGLFWMTDHYKDAGTATHRTYTRANCPPGGSYGGGPGSAHNFTTGLLHYYYLTGDPAARDAVISLADWVVNMDDGRRTIFGVLDDGPTGFASFTSLPDYHGPGRGCGNSVNALVDGWLATGRPAYLDKAESLIRRSVHPADRVADRDLGNAELRWSYTMYFSVLARYLKVKEEAGQLDSMYAYARASLLAYAGWMLENERPYYDHPEKLEFPTETWAAQELRKANVLRLAAAHAEEPLRERLLRRGDELAERGWSDLLRFESRTVARAIAVMLQEGTRDAFFRRQAPHPAPRPFTAYDFGVPETFVPQRQRVRARLKTARGLLGALARVADPRNWLRRNGTRSGP